MKKLAEAVAYMHDRGRNEYMFDMSYICFFTSLHTFRHGSQRLKVGKHFTE